MFLPSPGIVLLMAPVGVIRQDSARGLAQALETASPFPWGPVVLLAGPAVIAVTLLWLYARTARLLRRAQLAPPTWLLPYLETPGEERPNWPPPTADPDDAADLVDRQLSVARLGRRKRILLGALALNFVAGWAVAGVYLYESNRNVEFQEFPSTAELGSSVDTASFAGIEGPQPAAQPRATAPPVADERPPADTAAARARRERREAFFRQRDSLAELRRLDSVAIATAAAIRVRDSLAQAVRDSVARAARVVAAVPPTAPPPAPPPPPAAPPPPDPAVERAGASVAFRTAGQSLVGAVNGRSGIADHLAPGAARDRFVRFVDQNTPAATLASVSEPSLAEARAEAVVTIAFQWRGPFGDTRRRSGRFRADAVRGPAGWRVTGLVPLDNLQ